MNLAKGTELRSPIAHGISQFSVSPIWWRKWIHERQPEHLRRLTHAQWWTNINLSSTGVFNAHPGYAIYSAAKSAVEVFTRVLSKELTGRNITVNCVAPGATATEEWRQGKAEELLETIAKLSPLNRLGTPEDIAGLVAFLASPEGEWVNGQVIRVNGGFA
jgi:NAD(P)-dependent dehydrogenase (short-subunit alcohol dehydrogenase family)